MEHFDTKWLKNENLLKVDDRFAKYRKKIKDATNITKVNVLKFS